MSDTPRTDAAAVEKRDTGQGAAGMGVILVQSNYVPADFARTLERELAAARLALSDAQRRLTAFAELALAVEGKTEGFGAQLTAERHLEFLRETFLGEHAKGATPYDALCVAIDTEAPK